MRVRSSVLRLSLLAVALAAAGSGCESRDASPKATQTASPSKSEASEAPATAKVLYTYFNKSEKYGRVVIEISNPSNKTRTGVETTWKALDADGVIVDTESYRQTPIPPGTSVLYVDGTEDLAEEAERVTVAVTDPGRLTSEPPTERLEVSDAKFVRSASDTWAGAHDYDVTAVLTALADVSGGDVIVNFVLRDASGKIVGAEWADSESSSIPKVLAKGDKVKVGTYVEVELGKTPVTVDAYAEELDW